MNNFTRSFFTIMLFCILPAISLNAQDIPPYVTADGDQIYCTGSPMHIVTDFNITDPDDTGTNAVYIQISEGYVNGQDYLSLPAGHPTILASWNAATGKLSLTGVGGERPYADFISAVEDVRYTSTSPNPTGTRKFSITVGAANFLPATGHYYQFVPFLGITWLDAKTAAQNSYYFGLQGYLATLTMAEEAQLCGLQASGNGWIGGSDAAVEGVWRWETGPEAGTIFWNGGPAGSSPTYAFWNTGEPNNQGNEDYAHITAPGIGIPGSWNDLFLAGDTGAYASQGYVVEYGGMPGDPEIHISASTIIRFSKITSFTASSRCGEGTVNLAAVASNGALVHWYSSSTGATEIGTGSPFTTPVISSTTTFYASPYGSDCTTATRTAVIATVNPLPTITTTTPTVTVCQGSTATVQATPSTGTVNWYTTATGGTSIGTGTSFTTPAIPASTSYFAEAVSALGCVSATRVEIAVVATPQPTVTLSTPPTLCGQGSATLQATPSAGIVKWYSSATGGTPLATGTSYATAFLTTTTTFYAEAVDGTCISAARQPITVTITSLPVINSNTPASICEGQTATISAGTATGATINWYDSSTGGTLLGTGTNFTTPVLTTTTTYYAEAVNGTCVSSSRTLVQVTIIPTPTLTVTTPVTTCDGSQATLQATPSAGATVRWYTAATGGTPVGTGNSFTTPAITANTTYYTEAVNGTCVSSARTAVNITVTPAPTLTVTTPPALCAQGTATLQATPSAGSTVNWYTTPTGGTSIGTGNTMTSPVLTSTTTFYAEAVGATCTSARQPLTVTVNPLPVITSNTPASICEGQTATITAGSATGTTINWYSSATGGTLLGTGTSYTTPVLTATTTYYAEAVSAQSCVSNTRKPIQVTVNTLPTLTVTTPVTVCNGSVAILQATPSTGASVKWYTAATGGTSVGTGNSFTTPAITANTTYYAEAVIGTCVSAARTAVNITVTPAPTLTVTTPPALCAQGTATLQATPSAGSTVNWYTTANGGTPIGTGNSITSPVIISTTTFYAEAVGATCNSARMPLTVTVNPLPTILSTSNGFVCVQGAATIGAVPSSGTIKWYAAATGGTVLATGQTFTTPVLNATTNYYAEAVSAQGCISAVRTLVEVQVQPLSTVTVTTPVDVCGNVTATLEGVPSDGTVNWYDAPVGGHLIGTGNSIQSPIITGNRIFYAEASNNGCHSAGREAVNVFFHPLPPVGPDRTVLFCEGGDLDLDAGPAGMTYAWSTNETTKTINITTPGTYSVVVTSPDGCTATKTYTANTLAAPEISTVIVRSGDALVIMPNNDTQHYEFSVDGGPYQDSPQFYGLLNGYHTASVISRDGCGEDTYKFLVFVVPKFFTPNGDNTNELFTLTGMNQFPELTVDIFDRYGKMLIRLNKRVRGWDGTYNGHALPATDYWYVIKIDNTLPEIRGHFSLIR